MPPPPKHLPWPRGDGRGGAGWGPCGCAHTPGLTNAPKVQKLMASWRWGRGVLAGSGRISRGHSGGIRPLSRQGQQDVSRILAVPRVVPKTVEELGGAPRFDRTLLKGPIFETDRGGSRGAGTPPFDRTVGFAPGHSAPPLVEGDRVSLAAQQGFWGRRRRLWPLVGVLGG